MVAAVVPLLMLACASRAPTPAADPAPTQAVAASAAQSSIWTPLDGVRHLQCQGDTCVVALASGAREIDPVSLTLGDTAPDPGSSPAVALAADTPPPEQAWNQLIEQRWRSPFQARIPTPDGGQVTYSRGLGLGPARLVRTGGGLRARSAPGGSGPVAYPRWLALHQTGQQAYLVAWPHSEIIAFNPSTLATVWRLDLDAPAVGLFIDPTGRYLVVEIGGPPPPEQLLNFPAEPPAVPEGIDPFGDPYLSALPRPIATHTVVLDLQKVEIVLEVPGPFKAWVVAEGAGPLIATSAGVGRLP